MANFFIEQARRHLAARQVQLALQASRRATDEAPGDSAAWQLRATIEADLGMHAEALASAELAAQHAPADARACMLVADMAQAMNQHEKSA
ncbi:MAG TPA: hypothetical protein VHP55_01180, partial [Usitatibacter sp.]|nr:hypothetical protein [Usitatibacter sp.]